MMESPNDSTAVIRMRRDFEAFITDSGGFSDQTTLRLNLDAERLSVDTSLTRHRHTSSKNYSHQSSLDESIKARVEREKQEKLLRAELLAAQSRIVELETHLSYTKTSNKRARIEFEKDLEVVKSGQERELEKIPELRYKIRQLAESEQAAKSELVSAQKEWDKARAALETKLRSVQKERLTLEEEFQKEKDESWQKIMDLQQESGRCFTELELNVIELEETKENLKVATQRVDELTSQMAEFETLKQKVTDAEEKIKELEGQMSLHAEDATVNRALRADIEKVPGLEKELERLKIENEYFRQQKQNNLLLQEQLTSAQRKLETSENNGQALAKLQLEYEDLQERLQRWEALDTSGSRRPQSPSELSRRVSELQASEVLSLEQKGQLKSSISMLELQVRESREQQEKAQRELRVQQEQMQQKDELIKRLRRKLLLVTKERDSFKQILDSYESEVTLTVSSNSRVKELEDRLKQTKDALSGYQQQNTELETQLERLSELHQQATSKCLQLEQQCHSAQSGSAAATRVGQDQVAHLQEQLLEAEQALKKVTEEKETLEMRIEQRHLQGDYDPTRTKVLHFSFNPAAVVQQQRQQEVERLKEENERLTARVQLLENASGPVEDLTMQVDKQLESVPESKAIEELKSQLAKEELRKKRLVEAFKKTSQEFRETCYQLLGYKIDMPCSGQYRLASMYSDTPHDYLLFKQGESGEIQMLETDFSIRQQDKLEAYLENRGSIPALLSAITLELFNQQTLNLG